MYIDTSLKACFPLAIKKDDNVNNNDNNIFKSNVNLSNIKTFSKSLLYGYSR